MNVQPTALNDVLIIQPRVFTDDRGWFMENWRSEHGQAAGIDASFVQTNSSHSSQGVIRGLHHQWPMPQGKLVWVSHGEVFDVAVDIRTDSPQFGQWVGVVLDADKHQQLWIPPGFAHGFQVLSPTATFHYQCTQPYRPEHDRVVAFDDPDIAVQWPLTAESLSDKDQAAPKLSEIDPGELPQCASC